ncbi:MAG: hypothetical protein KKD18_03510 [Nanoarchaeota archaeon]|nr:hypothetical protein [Nanoarchaeota archaeon]MBU0977457.1 hypothetical protein [Nanoarchaeota archaeon]
MKQELFFTAYRFYLFLFFTACYTFLTFWITVTFFLFFPFAVFGFGLYVLVALFHRGIKGIVARNEGTEQKLAPWGFLIGLIIFALVYIAGVYWMQGLVVEHLGFSESNFRIVGTILEFVSIGLGIFLSFF